MYEEEQDVFEMRKVDECDLVLDNSEKTIAFLGGRW